MYVRACLTIQLVSMKFSSLNNINAKINFKNVCVCVLIEILVFGLSVIILVPVDNYCENYSCWYSVTFRAIVHCVCVVQSLPLILVVRFLCVCKFVRN